jgi:hypothetical protein
MKMQNVKHRYKSEMKYLKISSVENILCKMTSFVVRILTRGGEMPGLSPPNATCAQDSGTQGNGVIS